MGESLDYYLEGHHVDVDLASPHKDRMWLAGLIRSREDAGFIAHTREDVPALLAEVKRLHAKLTEAFDAGFAESGEGWNNEWPREFNAEQAKRYETARAVAVHEVLKTN